MCTSGDGETADREATMAERVVITRDLMDGSRFRTAATGTDLAIVRSAESPELADARIVLLDLATGIDPAVVVAEGRTVIAYGAHVDADALDAARAAGCDDALPRSVVFRRTVELLG